MKIELTKLQVQTILLHLGNSYGDGSYFYGRNEREDKLEEKKLKEAYKILTKSIGQNSEL